VATVPPRICLCASGATGHLVTSKVFLLSGTTTCAYLPEPALLLFSFQLVAPFNLPNRPPSISGGRERIHCEAWHGGQLVCAEHADGLVRGSAGWTWRVLKCISELSSSFHQFGLLVALASV
jgi:hypothetical protein